MSADWKAGDRAMRIAPAPQESGWIIPDIVPQKGTVYLVSEVFEAPTLKGLNIMLSLCGISDPIWIHSDHRYGWAAEKFRKIVPAGDRATNSASITKWEP